MSLGTTLTASFLVTLVRPATWPLALAAFLLRGGIVIVLAPVVAIPSVIGCRECAGARHHGHRLGQVSTAEVILVAGVDPGVPARRRGRGLIAAAAEAELTRIVADDEEVVAVVGVRHEHGDAARDRAAGVAGRILAVRLIAFLPLGLVARVGFRPGRRRRPIAS